MKVMVLCLGLNQNFLHRHWSFCFSDDGVRNQIIGCQYVSVVWILRLFVFHHLRGAVGAQAEHCREGGRGKSLSVVQWLRRISDLSALVKSISSIHHGNLIVTCSPPTLEQAAVLWTDHCQVAEGGEGLQGAREHPGSKCLFFSR